MLKKSSSATVNDEPVRPPMLKDIWTEQEWLDMFHKAYKEAYGEESLHNSPCAPGDV